MKIDFFTFLAILPYFPPIFGSKNRLKDQISQNWVVKPQTRTYYGLYFPFGFWDRKYFFWTIFAVPSNVVVPTNATRVASGVPWFTLVFGPKRHFHTLHYLWTQNLKDPSRGGFVAKFGKKCILLTKNSILFKGISFKMPHLASGENRFFSLFWQLCLIFRLFLVVKIG